MGGACAAGARSFSKADSLSFAPSDRENLIWGQIFHHENLIWGQIFHHESTFFTILLTVE
jgi:hypothetical protein